MSEDEIEPRESWGVKMEAGADAVRWVDLTAAQIAEMAHHQIAGDFGTTSDALTALHLIEAIAHRLQSK